MLAIGSLLAPQPLAAQKPPPPDVRATESLALDDAIRIALEHNAEFVVLRRDVEQAAARIVLERGPFSPRLVGNLRLSAADSPGDADSLPFEEQLLTGELAIRGRLHTGLEYSLEYLINHRRLDSFSTLYDPFQSTAIQLSLVQPLLRSAGTAIAKAPLRIAALRHESSRFRQQARAMQIVADVEIAYWGLVLAQKELEVLEEALLLAEQQLKESRTQLKLGAVAQIDLTEAEAAVARGKEQIQSAHSEIAAAESRLLALLQPGSREKDGKVVHFVPVTLPELGPDREVLTELLDLATKSRPDLAAARLDLEAAEVGLLIADNGLWPVVNLVGGAGVLGASGRLSRAYGTAGLNLPVVHGVTGEILDPIAADPRIEGGFLEMFRNMRYPRGYVGVQVEIPLDNSEAVAQHRLQRAEVAAQRATLEAQVSRVQTEVVAALEQLRADRARVRSTVDSVKLAERLLEGQKVRFKNGVAVSFDVLRASAAVTQARITQLRAQIGGRISEARLSLARGTYLVDRGIELETKGSAP